MIIRVNIGLKRANAIGLDHHHVAGLLMRATTGYCAEVTSYREVESAGGDWEPEPVLWAELEVVWSMVDRFKAAMESLCVALGEDSIAGYVLEPNTGDGTLFWHPHYTGEKYDFNIDYFAE